MFDRQLGRRTASIRTFEHVDNAALYPSHALAGCVVEGHQRHGTDVAFSEIALDPIDRHVPDRTKEDPAQQGGQGSGVEETMRVFAAKRNEGGEVGAKDVVAFQRAPETGELLHLLGKTAVT